MNVAFDSLRGLGSALAVLKAVEKLAYGKLLVDKRGAKRARGVRGIEEGWREFGWMVVTMSCPWFVS